MAQEMIGGVAHLTEGLLIRAYPPTDRVPITGNGGGGWGTGGWGLNEGPRRGEGGPGRYRGPSVPGYREVISEEHVGLKSFVDSEYQPRYAELAASIQIQINAVKVNAANAATTETQRQKAEHLGMLEFVAQKNNEYNQQASVANAFWGSSPFYKPSYYLAYSTLEAMKNGNFETHFADYMAAYGAAHESKILDLTLAAAIYHLAVSASAIEQYEDLALLDHQKKAEALAERAHRIRAEQQAHFQLLPISLQTQIVQGSGDVQGLNSIQALDRYQEVLRNMITHISVTVAPFVTANPGITAPLTRTELEALKSLVEGQESGVIGPRWKDYHQNLLHSEHQRHLQLTLSAFSALRVRAERLNQQISQANALEAERLLHEQQAREAQQLLLEQQAREAQQQLLEQQAREALLREAALQRSRITYASSFSATTLPFLAPMGSGSFSLAPATYGALQSAVRLAVPALRIAAIAGGPVLFGVVVVGTIAFLWIAAEKDQQAALSIPLADLSPPDGLDLVTAAATGATVELPYSPFVLSEEAHTTLVIADSSNVAAVGRVPVVAAQFDPQAGVYSVVLENPQRILTWTPASAPGNEIPAPTILPEHLPETPVYQGATLTPIQGQIESYPALDLVDQARIIVTFPADSGMAPILVMFKDRRMDPGQAAGDGIETLVVSAEQTRGMGAPIPARIAAQLKGKHFQSFRKFREAFWTLVGNDEFLSKTFAAHNIAAMKGGYAPALREEDCYGSQVTLQIHHIQPISKGGAVYDMDNLRIVTPKAHNRIHYGEKP